MVRKSFDAFARLAFGAGYAAGRAAEQQQLDHDDDAEAAAFEAWRPTAAEPANVSVSA